MNTSIHRIEGKVMRICRSFLPPKTYIRWRFRYNTGYGLNLEQPRSFNEKLQWLKFHCKRPEYTAMVDKFEAKSLITNMLRGGERLELNIIPTLGLWSKFEDIDFSKLPDKFVLKCTHDSGGLVVCDDKSKLDLKACRQKINKCLKVNYYRHNYEYPYRFVKPRIIAEEYMTDESGYELKDYKIFCFNGTPRFLKVDFNRKTAHKANYYDTSWNLLPFCEANYPCDPYRHIEKPINLNKMLKIAKALSFQMPFVRVDLYDIGDQIYFGELTFFPASGTGPIAPLEWDYKIGDMLTLPDD